MRKITLSAITRTIYSLFVIITIIVLFIVYKDIDGEITYKLITGYIFFAFFALLYFPIIVILNLRKFKWIDIRKRLFNFIILFLSFNVAVYVFNYFFRPSDIDLFRQLSISFGLAFGGTFMDVIFIKDR